MPKFSHGGSQDPMEREVDRLLAQLPYSGSASGRDPQSAPRPSTPAPGRSSQPMVVSSAGPRGGSPAALWGRVGLGLVLGALMIEWPYPTRCGWPLLGYCGAVAIVLLTGGWIALVSWKLRSGLAHVLALILVYWGIVLGAEQVLPRIGYASERASWQCRAEPVAPGGRRGWPAAAPRTPQLPAVRASFLEPAR